MSKIQHYSSRRNDVRPPTGKVNGNHLVDTGYLRAAIACITSNASDGDAGLF